MTGWVNGWDVMISIHGSESIWLGRPVGYPWVVVMVVVGGFKQVGGWVDGWGDGSVCVCFRLVVRGTRSKTFPAQQSADRVT